jgi:hypothetical protein
MKTAAQKPGFNGKHAVLLHTRMVILSAIILSLLPPPAMAQDQDFTLHSEISGVKVYYKLEDLDNTPDQSVAIDPLSIAEAEPVALSVVMLKMENTNDYGVSAEWFTQLKSENDGGTASLAIAAGETKYSESETSPTIMLSANPDDGYPVSVVESLGLLNISITAQ